LRSVLCKYEKKEASNEEVNKLMSELASNVAILDNKKFSESVEELNRLFNSKKLSNCRVGMLESRAGKKARILKIERELNKIDELFDLDETGCENEDKTE
jgi:hypothetical protein